MLTGSCLCAGIRYEAEGPLTLMARCHCTQCRKASGAEFATNASVPAAGFRVVTGSELLKQFEWSPGEARVFCGRCGSPLFKRSTATPDLVRLRLGCVDSEIEERPVAHVFVAEKPAWSEITDSLPQFSQRPKRFTQAVARALGLIAKRKNDEAQQQLDTGYAVLGMDRELLLILDGPTLARQLGDDQRITAAITLLLCDAELQLARTDRPGAQKRLRAAHRLRALVASVDPDIEQAFERVEGQLDA